MNLVKRIETRSFLLEADKLLRKQSIALSKEPISDLFLDIMNAREFVLKALENIPGMEKM